jgi:16S rRNA processing protein RimM
LYGSRRDRLSEQSEVTVFPSGSAEGERRPLVVESAWWHQDRLVLKFQGIDTISDAEALRGAAVCIPASQRGAAPAGEYFQDDLVGSEVIEFATGARLGRVEGWQECGGPPLLVVGSGEGEFLIPFAASICVSIDPERRRIVVDLPAGLKDLDRP